MDFWNDGGMIFMFKNGRRTNLIRPQHNSFEQEVLIFFDDLIPEAQERLLETFKTTVDKENWGMIPLVILKRKFRV